MENQHISRFQWSESITVRGKSVKKSTLRELIKAEFKLGYNSRVNAHKVGCREPKAQRTTNEGANELN